MNDDFLFSVEDAPLLNAAVIFTPDSSHVFREDSRVTPVPVTDDVSVIPWGARNTMPFEIMDLIDSDETMSTCMDFIQEVCYASGIRFAVKEGRSMPADAQTFLDENPIHSVFLGQCADMKMFDFCVSVIILNERNDRIVSVIRKEAAYCRFAKADSSGRIPYVVYAQWRDPVNADNAEIIPLLDPVSPLRSLRKAIDGNPRCHKYAVVSRMPKASSTYYPIPSYASIFRGSWFDIKKLIGVAKKAKLKNSAPIKYHIEVDSGYWDRAIKKEAVTDPVEKRKLVARLKKQMIDFLSGAENSGKVLFSSILKTPDGKDIPEVRVTKISSDEKEGGDYATDIQEAVNMICFAMRVHSNLVGSVPGKAQSNNSGSDKRELYSIAQTLQKRSRDVIFEVYNLVCAFNGWGRAVTPVCDIIQLTTLDKHSDVTSRTV